MQAGRSMLSRLPLLVGVEARHAPVWIAAIAAATLAAFLPRAAPAGLPGPASGAVVLGGLLAVAAIGFLPRTGSAALDAAWISVRAAWPVVGWSAAAVASGEPELAAWGCGGVVLGAGCLGFFARLSLVPADAAGTVLAALGVAGAAGWWATAAWGSDRRGAAVAAAVMLAGCVGALAASASRRSRGPARHLANHLLTGTAMAGALLGMVLWLFLMPDLARLDLFASAAWFVALALPAATLGDGVSHRPVWRRSERAQPHAAGWPMHQGPGRRRDTLRAPVVAAAILGWPPFVAAAVGGFSDGPSRWAVAIVALLAAAGLLLIAMSLLGDTAGVAPDVQQAAALAAVGLVSVALLHAAAGGPFSPVSLISLVAGG